MDYKLGETNFFMEGRRSDPPDRIYAAVSGDKNPFALLSVIYTSQL